MRMVLARTEIAVGVRAVDVARWFVQLVDKMADGALAVWLFNTSLAAMRNVLEDMVRAPRVDPTTLSDASLDGVIRHGRAAVQSLDRLLGLVPFEHRGVDQAKLALAMESAERARAYIFAELETLTDERDERLERVMGVRKRPSTATFVADLETLMDDPRVVQAMDLDRRYRGDIEREIADARASGEKPVHLPWH